ncbi:pentapeptide repeat-containing protein [Methylobacter sp. Wu8]|uniref:pentapeptide repeat-containing protein n=1 Tax=Methylobacter sp. Wu8 TaxID=3118457 RepID=UPI002F31B04A
MDIKHNLKISKPVSVWNKPLKIEPKKFLLNLAKALAKGAQGELENATETLADAFVDIAPEDRAGQLAWLLIYRAFTSALMELLNDSQDLFQHNDQEDSTLETLTDILSDHLNNLEVTIDSEFFRKPQELPLLSEFGKAMQHWLVGLGLSEPQAKALVQRLPDKFALALHGEWLNEPEHYSAITAAIVTPFTQAAEQQHQWMHYGAWLHEQVNQRMFAEAFSLQNVYVPLRAYYEEKPKEAKGRSIEIEKSETTRHVVDLQTELAHWVQNFKAEDAVRLISGGPGCGKSSFSKMFAIHVAEQTGVKVLFIPLHLFDLTADLVDAVGRFVNQSRYLVGNPLDAKEGENRLLVIFDGLDELSMQGKAAAQVAQEFIDEVLRKLDHFAAQKLQRQVLISGRDLVVQANANKFRQPKQILHVLPYFVPEKEREHYQDIQNLLDEDQRQIWWKNYGAVSGKNYQFMPENLSGDNLTEITCWPLLNYLVALSYERQQLDFNSDTSLNLVYQDLLEAVYERQYEGCNRRHQGTGNLNFANFCRILEEIALAIWHGDGRTTTVDYIQTRCKQSSLQRYLEEFQEGAERGVTRLLTAFYFRQSGEIKGERTFEFTHKSFGEYLTACRIVRMLEKVCQQIQRHDNDPDDGWDERQALVHWAEICGPTEVNYYLMPFINHQVALSHEAQILQWQEILARLIRSVFDHGMPMEKLGLNNFQEMLRQSCNAEEALLILHAACAGQTREIISLDLPDVDAFGSWLYHLRSQGHYLMLESLAFLDLQYIDLFGQFLYEADFEGANLSYANLYSAYLDDSFLDGACLAEADLSSANLTGAFLRYVNLEGASLINADFRGANLEGAIFTGADISGANFEGANLENTNLFEALNIELANLKNTTYDTNNASH